MLPTIYRFLRRTFSLWQNTGLGTRIGICLMMGGGLDWLIFPARIRGYYLLNPYLFAFMVALLWFFLLVGIVKLVIWSLTKVGKGYFANP